jgi:hypothetical protein
MDLPRKLNPNYRWMFPRLTREQHDVKSPKTDTYNCIAWAAADTKRWWWPVDSPDSYWPRGAVLEETVQGFIRVFQRLGYRVCQSHEFEKDFEKVAIFVYTRTTAEYRANSPSHMARQIRNGKWTSKLGDKYDIEHKDLKMMEGPEYGRLGVVLRRRWRRRA